VSARRERPAAGDAATTARATTARRRAREVLFRVLYQADVARDSWAEAWAARRAEEKLNADQTALVEDALAALETRGPEVDEALQSAAQHWALARLAATDRSVLRAAVAELLARPGMPARVILDEAIEIARRYGSDESGRFVNGVLDRVARTLRPQEFA
jgi:N utilization substance protein B